MYSEVLVSINLILNLQFLNFRYHSDYMGLVPKTPGSGKRPTKCPSNSKCLARNLSEQLTKRSSLEILEPSSSAAQNSETESSADDVCTDSD